MTEHQTGSSRHDQKLEMLSGKRLACGNGAETGTWAR